MHGKKKAVVEIVRPQANVRPQASVRRPSALRARGGVTLQHATYGFEELMRDYGDFIKPGEPVDHERLLAKGNDIFEAGVVRTDRKSLEMLQHKQEELIGGLPGNAVTIHGVIDDGSSVTTSLAPSVTNSTMASSGTIVASIAPDRIVEEIMLRQDRNGLLIAHRALVLKQNAILRKRLDEAMAESIDEKVAGRCRLHDMEKRANATDVAHRLKELSELASQLVDKVVTFKTTDPQANARAVAARYAEEMERCLGIIYAHRAVDPLAEAKRLAREAKEAAQLAEDRLHREHEQNYGLEKEWRGLQQECDRQQLGVKKLVKENVGREDALAAVTRVGEAEIAAAEERLKAAWEVEEFSGGASSARAVVLDTQEVPYRRPSSRGAERQLPAVPIIRESDIEARIKRQIQAPLTASTALIAS